MQRTDRHPCGWCLWPRRGLALGLVLLVLAGGTIVGRHRLGHWMEDWQDRQPAITPLQPAAAVAIDAQPAYYAALADLSQPLLGGGRLEVLGNPAAHRYPDCAQAFARNPWDLIAFDGRLYVGLGDDSNEGPSANAGPVPVYTYDPADQCFRQDTTLAEEQLDRFYRHDGELWIAGDDPRQSWRWGNLYRRDAAGGWRQFRTLPRTIHTHALAWHSGRLFAGISITAAVPAGIGTERYGSAVAVSADGGAQWDLIPLGGWRIFDFLQIGGQLFATDIFPGPGIQRWLEREQRQAFHAPVYEWDAADQAGTARFRRRPDLDAAALFPATPLAGRRAAIIDRALTWGTRAAYLGAFARAGDTWPVRGAYLATSLKEGAVEVERLPLPADALAFDLRLDGEALQVLFAEPLDTGRWINSIWSSRDGEHWWPQLRFMAAAPALSFERLGDDLYLALGSLQPPAADTCASVDACTGILIRWRTP